MGVESVRWLRISSTIAATSNSKRTPENVLVPNSESEDILQTIVAHKRTEIEAARVRRPLADLERALASAPPVRGFVEALKAASGIALIAEVKKASPSAGIIRHDFDPVAIAKIYEKHGANCLSVLTDGKFFQGRLDDLTAVKNDVAIPVMRKEFIIDPYQVMEARVAGADCILLIAECLDDCRLRELYFQASDLGMDVLIEIHEPHNLDRVLKLDPPVIGINNRNLRLMKTDLAHTLDLVDRIPSRTLLVSESGIKTNADLRRLHNGGAKAILVGESLMKSPDIGRAVDELLGR